MMRYGIDSGVLNSLRWPAISQALSSLSNVAISLAIVRVATAKELGGFAIVMTACSLALVVGRSAVGHPAVIYRHATELVQAVGMSVGLGVAFVSVPPLLLLADQPLMALVLGAVLPFVLAQDGLRSRNIGLARGRRAAMSDLLWLSSFAVCWVTLTTAGRDEPDHLFVSWAAAGVLSLVPLVVRVRPGPVGRALPPWWRQSRKMAGVLVLDSASVLLANQAVVVGLGVAAGLGAIGQLRASQLLLSPVNLLVALLPLVVIPRVKQWDKTGVATRKLLQLVAGFAVAPMVLLAVILVVPDTLGQAVLAQGWSAAQEFVVPVAIGTAGAGAVVVIGVFLRARQQAGTIARARLAAVPIESVGPFLGLAGGARAVVIGAAAGQVVAVLPWAIAIRLRHQGRQRSLMTTSRVSQTESHSWRWRDGRQR
jgi:hypothetical protein